MKTRIFLIFLVMFSFSCQGQTDTISKKDTSNRITIRNNFYSFKDSKNNSILFTNNPFDLKKISSSFDLFHDSLYIREVFYNTFFPTENKILFIYNNHFYYVSDPLKPYGGGVGSALIFGSLNYLFQLFDKK